MRLIITFEPLEDFSYEEISKHMVQGFIYSLLKTKDNDFSKIHDSKKFKFFCFSDIFPVSDFKNEEAKMLLVSSPNKNFIKALAESLRCAEVLKLGSHEIYVKDIKEVNLKLKNRFISGSPIVLYKDNKKNLYYSFKRDRNVEFFIKRLEENAVKKFNAFYSDNYSLEERIFDKLKFKKEVSIENVKNNRKFIIIGSVWSLLEKFHIKREDRKFYEFIMDCGLGEKNSFGFGFINPIR
ncbi:MAG: CRISPR-associated endoribonuclease Cas6 [Candidatus Altiarchaeota archaeon]